MKRILSVLITLGILVVLFLNININDFVYHFSNLNLFYFSLSMLVFVLITLVGGFRWKYIVEKDCHITFIQSAKLLLACASITAVTPSKAGDFAKAYFMKKDGKLTVSRGISNAAFEKYLDLLAIALFSIFGVFFIFELNIFTLIALAVSVPIIGLGAMFFVNFPMLKVFNRLFNIKIRGKKIGGVFEDIYKYHLTLKHQKVRILKLMSFSLLLWSIHFLQTYLFFLSLNFVPPIETIFAFVPIAILVGMIPVTVSGIGTRDSALIVLFSNYAAAPLMLGIGFLMTLRYWIPALFGLPFTRHYLKK